MPTAARILWRSAQCPLRGEVTAHPAVCWWCGLPSDLTGARREIVSDTFPDRPMARARYSERVCAACAWSLSQQGAIPKAYAAKRILSLCEQGRRMQGVIDGEAGRWLALRLDNGQIGLWSTAANAKAEDGWKSEVASLRTDPRDVGVCRFLRAVPAEAIEAGSNEIFRNYHHFGGINLPWEVATDSDKSRIRHLLLSPPEGEYVAAIGDGQKHAIIYAEPGLGPYDCRVYYRPTGKTVTYEPLQLAAQLYAVEQLIAAGADDEEVVKGKYTRFALPMMAALRIAEPIVAPLRGSATLDLLLYLRRTRPELKEDIALGQSVTPPAPSMGLDAPTPQPIVEPARDEFRPAPEPEPEKPVETSLPPRGIVDAGNVSSRRSRAPKREPFGQLSLFGG